MGVFQSAFLKEKLWVTFATINQRWTYIQKYYSNNTDYTDVTQNSQKPFYRSQVTDKQTNSSYTHTPRVSDHSFSIPTVVSIGLYPSFPQHCQSGSWGQEVQDCKLSDIRECPSSLVNAQECRTSLQHPIEWVHISVTVNVSRFRKKKLSFNS